MTAAPVAQPIAPVARTKAGGWGTVFTRRRGTTEWSMVVRGSGIFALLTLPVVLYVPGAAGLTVFIMLTIWVNGPLSPVLPATYEPILIIFGQMYTALLIAGLGTVATLFIEYINYRLHQRLLGTTAMKNIAEGVAARRVVTLFARRPAFTVWLCAWSPLPYWPVRVLSPLAGLPLRTHLAATLLGRFPRLWFVAAVGTRLHLSTTALVAITTGSIALAGLAWAIRRRELSRCAPSPQ
jgi:membrane protein YqaA with SNARE-associated domain